MEFAERNLGTEGRVGVISFEVTTTRKLLEESVGHRVYKWYTSVIKVNQPALE